MMRVDSMRKKGATVISVKFNFSAIFASIQIVIEL
jgi:hypothetical protein